MSSPLDPVSRQRLVTAADIARERSWHRVTALRWLKKLHAERGKDFAWMQDGQWVTSRAALQVLADEERARLIVRIEPRVARLEEELSEERQRGDALASEFYEFRRQANEWLRRGRK